MRGRIARVSAVGLALLALAPNAAFADLGLIFDRARAVPGERVEAYSGRTDTGRPSAYPPIEGVRLYFVPLELGKRQTNLRSAGPPPDPRWIPLGPLRQDAAGVIRMRFRVPRVPPGDYTTGFWCRPCAPPKGDFFTSALPQDRWRPKPDGRVIRIRARGSAATQRSPGPAAGSVGADGQRTRRVVLGIVAGLLLVGASVAAVSLSRRRASN